MKRPILAALGLILATALSPAARASGDLVVFAAASTTNALTEIGHLFTAKTHVTVRPAFAASSTLAKQIALGAPAGLFVSADIKWMDYLDQKKMIVPGSRIDLLGNSLVLIAPSSSKLAPMTITKTTDLVKLLGHGRLATGDPSHVPVGIYAKQALKAMNQWQAIEPRLARAESVRSGLALVERGEVPLGIVYATDAAITRRVKVIGTFPDTMHKPIVYPAGLVTGNATPAAKQFLAFLKTRAARAVFAKYGFTVLK